MSNPFENNQTSGMKRSWSEAPNLDSKDISGAPPAQRPYLDDNLAMESIKQDTVQKTVAPDSITLTPPATAPPPAMSQNHSEDNNNINNTTTTSTSSSKEANEGKNSAIFFYYFFSSISQQSFPMSFNS